MYYTMVVCLLITLGAQVILCKEEEHIGKLVRRPVIISGEDGAEASKRVLVRDASKLWPNATIVYTFIDGIEKIPRDSARKAMEMIENKTCIRFKRRTNETDYVFITNTIQECASWVGRIGGKQDFALGTASTEWCSTDDIAHELGHAAGIGHEHTRTDRDKYVKLCVENFSSLLESRPDIIRENFDIRSNESYDSPDLPYDYYSFFHYYRYDEGYTRTTASGHMLPLFVPLQKGLDGKEPMMGQSKDLTGLDIMKFNLLYGCDGTKPLGIEETIEEKRGPCGDSYNAKACNHIKSRGYCKTYPRTLRPVCGKTCQLCV